MFLSIMGMYEYDNSVFNGLNIPEGIDREALINEICFQCAELEIIYPNIDTMKLAITAWSISNKYTWEKLYNTLNLTYNPIWNVDADIVDIESGKNNKRYTDQRSIDTTDNSTNLETRNLKDKETVDLTDTKAVQGFNTTTWANAEKIEKSGTDTVDKTGTDLNEYNNKSNVSDDLVHSEDGENETTHTTRRTGNIGVTTTQQMIEQERNIAEFSIINYIVQSFKERFCILIY
mgnify:CR=1 FL=1